MYIKIIIWTAKQTSIAEIHLRFHGYVPVPPMVVYTTKDECTVLVYIYIYIYMVVGRDSVVGIVTRYELDGLGNESRLGARFSAPVQTGPGAYPASCTMGTGLLPGVKRPGRGVDHPPPSSTEVKERVQLYLYSPSGPSWPVLGWTLP
jgi:hypothetical protein